ncbi:MAG: histidine kinase dimerization/phospho-acceptor domain-containing protein, partial [Terriglobia bacterium]
MTARCRKLLEFAHDLRNLILPTLTSAELLLESGDLSSPQRTLAKRIVQQIDRVESLIEDTLLVS